MGSGEEQTTHEAVEGTERGERSGIGARSQLQ